MLPHQSSSSHMWSWKETAGLQPYINNFFTTQSIIINNFPITKLIILVIWIFL